MKRTISAALLLSTVALGGCMTMPRGSTSVDAEPLDKVINRIKADIASYNAYAALHATETPLNNACGGHVNLRVSGVTVQVATITENSIGVEAGAEVPIGPVTLGLGGSGKNTKKQSQTLNFKLIPKPGEGIAADVDDPATRGPFANALVNLRESLLKSSANKPCFTFPDGDDDNSIEFGFNLVRERGGEGKISFLIFSLGGSKNHSREVGNTITVQFTGEGVSAME